MYSSVVRNPLKINLHVWFYFILFLIKHYINTCEAGQLKSSILLSLSASYYCVISEISSKNKNWYKTQALYKILFILVRLEPRVLSRELRNDT